MKVLFLMFWVGLLQGQTTGYNLGLDANGNPCLILSKQTGDGIKFSPVCFTSFEQAGAAAVMIRQMLESHGADLERQKTENNLHLIQINRVLDEVQRRLNAGETEGKNRAIKEPP